VSNLTSVGVISVDSCLSNEQERMTYYVISYFCYRREDRPEENSHASSSPRSSLTSL